MPSGADILVLISHKRMGRKHKAGKKINKKKKKKRTAFAKGTSFIISDMKISGYAYCYSHVNSTSKPVVAGQYCSVYQ